MMGTSVLNHNPHLLPSKDLPQSSECSLKQKEQEYLCLLKKCRSLEEFKQVHVQILKLSIFWDSFCSSSLLATCALSDWSSMDYACSIFQQLDEPTTFHFNTMIRGHVNNMNFENALYMYDDMLQREVEPDNFTYPALLKACARLAAMEEGMQVHGHILKLGLEEDLFIQNSLINMYGKCRDVERSCAIFRRVEQRSVASWSAIIAAHASLGLWWECLMLFEDMSSEGCWRAEESILVSVLSACTHLGALHLGRCAHGSLLRNITELNVTVMTSLIDMYVKCGSLQKGLCLFQNMTKKNQLSYSVIISGLGLHGHGREALKIFTEMIEEGLDPDDVTYVGALSACNHSGLVNEGLHLFDRMKSEHGIEPTMQHYGCMVDLMGRAGMLEEAFELIQSMPIKPNDIVWRSLLSACKIHDNLKFGEIAAKNLFLLSSHNPGDYLVLSNMYARAQEWENAAKTRTKMVNNGLIQTPGFSLVEVERKVYKFVSQDKSNCKSGKIYEMVHQMEWQLRFEGYMPNTSEVMLDVDEEEKRERLKGHSQKLAIAFALIHTSQGSAIRIIRNLRMCNDCHIYTKLISMIYEREIIVRDRNRFHHFKDGNCSCRDYW
ncbi:pentatricopeptide repeat-containing protein At1g31920 [Momordica charantia]|uniref:Pentatricopeptide repeat-containing protein At1g31920 n=1 Tax=Momordica charantia TaxID=3673 RepID=A0A6J1DY28_MOMCH|nr:pentatricopeptide repeat-containing protein At1g31920 [Momordica charantia]